MFQAHSFSEITLSLVSASGSNSPTILFSKLVANLKDLTKMSKQPNKENLFLCHSFLNAVFCYVTENLEVNFGSVFLKLQV